MVSLRQNKSKHTLKLLQPITCNYSCEIYWNLSFSTALWTNKTKVQQKREFSDTEGASFPVLFNNNERANTNTSAENILQTNNAPRTLISLNSKLMMTVTQRLYIVTLTCYIYIYIKIMALSQGNTSQVYVSNSRLNSTLHPLRQFLLVT